MRLMTLSCIITAMMAMAACSTGSTGTATQQDTTPQRRQVPAFAADSAWEFARTQCDMGPRVPGTDAHDRCAGWLQQRLRHWCDTVVLQTGEVTTFDNVRLQIRNVVGVVNPQAPQRLLLMAHWDCRPWADADSDPGKRRQPVMGANDGASGVAVLMEVARAMHGAKPAVGVDIVLTDAEDWGDNQGDNEESWALGTQYWLAHPHVAGYKPTFGILLDMVGAPDARFTHEFFSRQYAAGFVDHVWQAAAQAGHADRFVGTQGGAVTDDHVFVNRAGIPCIDIIDLRANSEHGFFAGWHTTHDTLDGLDRTTMQAVGETLLQVIYGFAQ